MMKRMRKYITYVISAVLASLLLHGCADKEAVPTDIIISTPPPTLAASSASPDGMKDVPSFNPIYDFYSDYNRFTAHNLNKFILSLEEIDLKTQLKLSEHLYATTLPMNTVGMLISSGDDYYGDLFDAFEGSGSILTYPDHYEFSYDFSTSERLWGTLKNDELVFYKTIPDSDSYFKMTLTKNENGYVSSFRSFDGTTTLTFTADTVTFE